MHEHADRAGTDSQVLTDFRLTHLFDAPEPEGLGLLPRHYQLIPYAFEEFVPLGQSLWSRRRCRQGRDVAIECHLLGVGSAPPQPIEGPSHGQPA